MPLIISVSWPSRLWFKRYIKRCTASHVLISHCTTYGTLWEVIVLLRSCNLQKIMGRSRFSCDLLKSDFLTVIQICKSVCVKWCDITHYILNTVVIFKYWCSLCLLRKHLPAQVNNRNTRKRIEMSPKLTMRTPERRHWRRSGVFVINFEHILHHFLVFLLLTSNW